MKNSVSVKKVFGVKSVVINNASQSNIEAEYIKASQSNMPFYISQSCGLVRYGTFSICELLGIKDCSTLIAKING